MPPGGCASAREDQGIEAVAAAQSAVSLRAGAGPEDGGRSQGRITDLVSASVTVRGTTVELGRPSAAGGEVEDRVQVGHWKGDLTMGAGNGSAIGMLVARSTWLLIVLPSPPQSRPPRRSAGRSRPLANLPQALRRTLTRDQGKELALPRRRPGASERSSLAQALA
jgi:hypothetical protein